MKVTVGRALVIGCSTWLIVALGVWFSTLFVPRTEYPAFAGFLIKQPPKNVLNGFASWDGAWHSEIARDGYRYKPGSGSHVVFFPLYPLLGRVLSTLLRCDETVALLLVSNACFLGALCVLHRYACERKPAGSPAAAELALLACCVLPASFFFRMAYAESLFLLLTLLIVYGMQARWSDWWLAALVGAATGTRAVGVVLVLVFAHHLWTSRRSGFRDEVPTAEPSHRAKAGTDFALLRGLCLLAVSCWGLLDFMAYLWLEYGDPLVWQTNHAAYNRLHDTPLGERLLSLLSLRPIWSVFVPGSPGYWADWDAVTPAVWSLRLVNPIYFVAACGLVAYGAWSRTLETRDVLVGALLLLVPYVTKGHDNAMLGFARYSSVVYPMYLVAGDILARFPRPLTDAMLVVSAVLMSLYSALFAAWYLFI